MDWKQTLGSLAPTLGAAFGPLGAAGGLAIKKLLGVEGSSDEELVAYLQTPEGALKLKQAEYDYNLKMKQLEVDSDALDVQNTKDARLRDTEIQKTKGRNERGDVLAYMAVGTFLIVIVGLLFIAIPQGTNRDIIMMLLGVLAGISKDIYQFEFGSSRGSKEKSIKY